MTTVPPGLSSFFFSFLFFGGGMLEIELKALCLKSSPHSVAMFPKIDLNL